MAALKGTQVTSDMPIPAHGDASSVKCQRFVVQSGAAIATTDTIDFGDLPHYARVVDVIALSDQAITLNVGDAGDVDRYFAAQALTANTAARMTVGTGFRRTPALGALRITGAATVASGAATKLELLVFYVIEDAGVGYPAT